jgi:hypothetical protein
MCRVITGLEATVGKDPVASSRDFRLACKHLAAVDLQHGIRFGTSRLDALRFGNKYGATGKCKADDQNNENTFSHDFLAKTYTIASRIFGLVKIMIRTINHRVLIVIWAKLGYAEATSNCASFGKVTRFHCAAQSLCKHV